MNKLLVFLLALSCGCATKQISLVPSGAPSVVSGPVLRDSIALPTQTFVAPSFVYPPIIYSSEGQSFVSTNAMYYRPISKVEWTTDGVNWQTDTNFPEGTCFRTDVDTTQPYKYYRITPLLP